MLTFSIVICTYNRVELLKRALNTLLKQRLPLSEFEIIVIDNNSKDNTAVETAKYVLRYSNIRYFCETNIGLSHARNRGYSESCGRYVVYTDDDCELPADWLLNANAIIKSNAPSIMGGPVFAFYLNGKGKWYKDDYAILGHGSVGRVLANNEFLFGGNFFIKKDLINQFGLFKPELGMNGTVIGYSEETELQMRIRNGDNAIEIYYDPSLFVYHLVRPEKLKIKWWIQSFIAKGKSNYYLAKTQKQTGKTSAFLNCLRIIKISSTISYGLFYACIFRNRKVYGRPENYIYENLHQHFKELGYLIAGI